MEQGGSWFQTQLTDFSAHLLTVQHVDNVAVDDDCDDDDNIMDGSPIYKALCHKDVHPPQYLLPHERHPLRLVSTS